MSPSAAPTSPRGEPEPVDRLGPRPIARVRSGRDRSSSSSPRLRLRFADERCEDEPAIELPTGEVTLVEGTRGTEAARHRLVLDAASAGRATVNVVASERLDTTGLARRAQARGLDPGYVLRSSIVARAFTAYQLSVLLEERLPAALEAERAAAGVVLDPLRLYTDEDVKPAEARRLAEQAVDRLQTVADGFDVPLVVMQPPRGGRRALTRLLREAAGQHVLVRAEPGTERVHSGQQRPAYTVHLPKQGRRYRVQDPRPRQTRLDRYQEGDGRG